MRPIPGSPSEGAAEFICAGNATENIGLCTTYPWTSSTSTCRIGVSTPCTLRKYELTLNPGIPGILPPFWEYIVIFDPEEFEFAPCDYHLRSCGGNCGPAPILVTEVQRTVSGAP